VRFLTGLLCLLVGLCVGLVLMVFKDAGWLATPHPVSLAIAVICLALGVIGAVMTAQQLLHLIREREPSPVPAHARRPPVRDEPLP
jgi:hypothetical protein